jgi:hypothetical protein
MIDGSKKTRFKTVVPLMVYVSPNERDSIKSFAKDNGIKVSQLAREAFDMRMASGNQFNEGFNKGLNEAMKIAKNCNGAQMMFPSGKSYATIVCDDIKKFLREQK